MHSTTLRRLAVIALLPSAAFAQRGVNVRGEHAGDIGGRAFTMPRASDLEDHTPVTVVLDKKKKLALTDSQVIALKGISRQLKAKNAAFYDMWDSTRIVMRQASAGSIGGGTPSQADQERLATARAHLMAIRRPLQENDAWARDETLKILTEAQKPRAAQFWADDVEEFSRSMGASGRPGGAGDAGGPGAPGAPGGRRPPGA